MTCACGREVETRFGMTRACPCGAPPAALREVGELDTRCCFLCGGPPPLEHSMCAACCRKFDEGTRRVLAQLAAQEECQTPADRGERAEAKAELLVTHACLDCGATWNADPGDMRHECPGKPPPPAPAAETVCYECGATDARLKHDGNCFCQGCVPLFDATCKDGTPCYFCGVDHYPRRPCVEAALAEVRRPGFVPRRNRKT